MSTGEKTEIATDAQEDSVIVTEASEVETKEEWHHKGVEEKDEDDVVLAGIFDEIEKDDTPEEELVYNRGEGDMFCPPSSQEDREIDTAMASMLKEQAEDLCPPSTAGILRAVTANAEIVASGTLDQETTACLLDAIIQVLAQGGREYLFCKEDISRLSQKERVALCDVGIIRHADVLRHEVDNFYHHFELLDRCNEFVGMSECKRKEILFRWKPNGSLCGKEVPFNINTEAIRRRFAKTLVPYAIKIASGLGPEFCFSTIPEFIEMREKQMLEGFGIFNSQTEPKEGINLIQEKYCRFSVGFKDEDIFPLIHVLSSRSQILKTISEKITSLLLLRGNIEKTREALSVALKQACINADGLSSDDMIRSICDKIKDYLLQGDTNAARVLAELVPDSLAPWRNNRSQDLRIIRTARLLCVVFSQYADENLLEGIAARAGVDHIWGFSNDVPTAVRRMRSVLFQKWVRSEIPWLEEILLAEEKDMTKIC